MTEDDAMLLRGLLYIAVAVAVAWLTAWVIDSGQERGRAAVGNIVVLEPATETTRVVEVVMPAEPSASAVRLEPQVQVTPTLPPPTTEPRPVPVPGDCDSWAAVFRWYGATDREVEFFFVSGYPWGVPRTNIIRRESGCGLDFVNEATSDRYVCMLNGINWTPGYAYGTYYPNGWPMDVFGFRGGRSITTQQEASNPAIIPACLWLLRGGTTPDAFEGVSHWRPQ